MRGLERYRELVVPGKEIRLEDYIVRGGTLPGIIGRYGKITKIKYHNHDPYKVFHTADKNNRIPRYELYIDSVEKDGTLTTLGYIMNIMPEELVTVMRYSLKDILKEL